mmetsp:Transcript_51850/g.160851  ORF Transcript_51850/g.160851 Transcript_51850/m.160851 type:complete len:211 (+) Transcript_51850:339-971(+)
MDWSPRRQSTRTGWSLGNPAILGSCASGSSGLAFTASVPRETRWAPGMGGASGSCTSSFRHRGCVLTNCPAASGARTFSTPTAAIASASLATKLVGTCRAASSSARPSGSPPRVPPCDQARCSSRTSSSPAASSGRRVGGARPRTVPNSSSNRSLGAASWAPIRLGGAAGAFSEGGPAGTRGVACARLLAAAVVGDLATGAAGVRRGLRS